MCVTKVRTLALLGVCVLALTACEQTRQSLGLDRVPPDEFAVVTRAPLSVPPGIDLQPPRPGAPRPQEPDTRDTASAVLFNDRPTSAAPAPSASSGIGSLGLAGLGFGGGIGASGLTPPPTAPSAAPVAPAAPRQSAGEQALLQMVGADHLDPNIRAQVDAETSARISADTRFIDRLLSLDVPRGLVVDASAEADRIRRNQALGVPLTEGEVPRIERRGKALFEGIF
jgi:hypothetical protein